MSISKILLNVAVLLAVILFSSRENFAQTSDSSSNSTEKVVAAKGSESSKKSTKSENAEKPKKENVDKNVFAKPLKQSFRNSIEKQEKLVLATKTFEELKRPAETPKEEYRPLPKPSATPPKANRQDFPSPVADNTNNSLVLFELLEYNATANGNNALTWDMIGWYGGDYNRLWFRSEGEIEESSRAAGDVEFQALYGRMIAPFFDFQAGIRYDQKWEGSERASRFHAVVGLVGLSPYEYEVEPLFFVSNRGDVSFRFTGAKDILITQKTIFEARFETNLAVQKVPKFGVGSGLNDMEFGFRFRREIKREFAPYIGVSYKRLFGQTADFARFDGGRADQLSLVAGVRLWF